MHRAAAIACSMLFAAAAQAAPPIPGSADYLTLAPYKDWAVSQTDPLGRPCCDIGDGRPVDAKIVGDRWLVHITPEHFPGLTERWQVVPENKLTRGANPTGRPVVWMYHEFVQCFAAPEGM